MNLWLLLIPVISAFIGWFTNWIAIKMLFHPREPKKFLGITFQGIFPKRQAQFAEKLGKLVADELLSFKDIEQKITSPENLSSVMPYIENHIDEEETEIFDLARDLLDDEEVVGLDQRMRVAENRGHA